MDMSHVYHMYVTEVQYTSQTYMLLLFYPRNECDDPGEQLQYTRTYKCITATNAFFEYTRCIQVYLISDGL